MNMPLTTLQPHKNTPTPSSVKGAAFRHKDNPRKDPRGRRPRQWTPPEDKLLGTMTDAGVGRRLNCSISTVWCRRRLKGIPKYEDWSPAEERWLGVLTDSEIARKLGITRQAVWVRRKILGIARSPRQGPNWAPEQDKLLGAMPDGQLARAFGCSLSAVWQRRHLIGISKYSKWRDDNASGAKLGITRQELWKRRIKQALGRLSKSKRGSALAGLQNA